MHVKIQPSRVSGSVSIPASKSIVHRAIICASLAQGTSTISNISFSKDIEATIQCMRSLGAKIDISANSCIIQGSDLKKQRFDYTCLCNESGSTLRFLLPIGATLACKGSYYGKGRLLDRPMKIYEDIFSKQQLFYQQDEEKIQIQGPLRPGEFIIPGDVSSQFISGLLFALPLLDKPSTLTVLEPYESKSYVHLTLDMLRKFGIEILEQGNQYQIPANQTYKMQNVKIEGDYSQMAFFGVLATLNHELEIYNMNPYSLQGDQIILKHLSTLQRKDSILVSKTKPKGKTIDLANCPDLGPILCVLASFSEGETNIIHAKRLRMKESDRILAMETELKKWGVDITSTEDTITIHGKDTYSQPQIVEIDSHNDHRIVMAMTIFGLCANSPSIIHNAQAITKSYPNFFKDIQAIHGKVEIQ